MVTSLEGKFEGNCKTKWSQKAQKDKQYRQH